MIKVLSVAVTENLRPLSQSLAGQKIAHRISEQAGKQIVWVVSKVDVELVLETYRSYQRGQLFEPVVQQSLGDNQPEELQKTRPHTFQLILVRLGVAPCVSALILISTVITALLATEVVGHRVFGVLSMEPLSLTFASGELWRLLTPIFLHFDVMHLVFNMLLLWVFAGQIERYEKGSIFLILLLLFALIPNVAQTLIVGPNFGGMSGVVYAALGYCWLYNRLNRQSIFAFPNALMGLMVVWLLLGFTGILTGLGMPPMANIAHLGGLLVGFLCALGMAQRQISNTERLN
jgi:GlpG protein